MMKPSILATALGFVFAAAAVSQSRGAPVTTASLLGEMMDLAGMSRFPEPAFTCRQFSSYDRKSESPDVEWFANGDCGQYLREEETQGRKEFVMMDAEGPGAVVRIWSANPAGTLRVYLDHSERPAIEAPMTDLLGGGFPGLPVPLAGERSKGWNLYFPIAYAGHCKITSDAGNFYYHVNYRTYPEGTPVETFELGDLKDQGEGIRRVVARLKDPAGARADGGGDTLDVTLQPGAVHRIKADGSKAFTIPSLRVDAPDLEAALRGVVLKANFDGEDCVEAPLGDFFGSAPGINPFRSLPLGMLEDGTMYSNWVMPFQKSAVIELVNLGTQAVRIRGRLASRDYEWSGRSMHFHAGWRAGSGVPVRPMIDWNYLDAKGRGVFAGASFTIDNPVTEWWGEGDEKIFVDGEKFPSHFGTGTEDYYGYAWCFTDLFTHAYHSQSRCDGPQNYGRTSVNRFHVIDRIPFRESLRFDMELWHWHERCEVNMAVTSYWYARPGGGDGFPPVTAEQAVVQPMDVYQVPRVAGAIEGEELRILAATGTASPQQWQGLSNGAHLWWHVGVVPQAGLKLGFPVPESGRYRVFGRFMQARDYGIHQLSVNGVAAGDAIDFHHRPDPVPGAELELGSFDLKMGENTLDVIAIGSNPESDPGCMFGLDYLRIEAVE